MKSFVTVCAILMFGLAFNVQAWSLFGADMVIDGKTIRIASVKKNGVAHIFHSRDKELENGVYVVAVLDSTGHELPQSTALIRNYLRSIGFNVADKMEGSSLAIRFSVGSLSIDQMEATPSSTSASKAGGEVNFSGAATMAGVNPFKGANILMMQQSWHKTGVEIALNSIVIPEPSEAKLGDGTDQPNASFGITATTMDKNSDPNTTKADLLTLMTKVWADKYFVKD